MIPELGHYALVLALALAVLQSVLPLVGAQIGNARLMAVAGPAVWGQFTFLWVAMVCLAWSFVVNDFSVLYVASNSNTELPLAYRLSAIWGAHEGSLLLWVLMLAGWAVAVAMFSNSLPQAMRARILGVMGLVSLGFLIFIIFTENSNPFVRLFPPAPEGRDLNPLLQDPGLVLHPPMLYMGYVGFSVAFAFAIAALMAGQVDSAWARWSRPWTTAAWVSLTLGIALGSWWAYNELGWGGWWFWDPVENASFMPWLAGTALIHSLAVTEKRGAFKHWTLLLAISAFSLSLLGAFLVRSGVLVSVHAFATDPERGVFILVFLGLVVGISLALYAWRAPSISRGGGFGVFSRETLLLSNNLLMISATFAVFLGTLYPLFIDALGLGKISVGPPYFDFVFGLLMLPALALMVLGPLSRWKHDDGRHLLRSLWPLAAVSALVGMMLPFAIWQPTGFMIFVGSVLGVWVILGALFAVSPYLRGKSGRFRLKSVPAHILGMVIAHVGVGVFALGVTFVNSFDIERDLVLTQGQEVDVGGYHLVYEGTEPYRGPNYDAQRSTVQVWRDGEFIATLYPEKRRYRMQPDNPMTEAAIHISVFRDLYVSLGERVGPAAWSMRIQVKPFVRWIWVGCLLMSIGGIIAISDRRYRVKVRRAEVAADLPSGAAPGTGAA